MSLDLSSLENAIAMLQKIYQKAEDKAFMGQLDEITQNAIRSGTIQHFEMVYELSWKFIQRWIKINVSIEEANAPRTRKDLFRLAAASGLITSPEHWFDYSNARNLTSHTYNQDMADKVYQEAGGLLRDASELLRNLKDHND